LSQALPFSRLPFLAATQARGLYPANTKIVTSVSDFVKLFSVLVMAGLDPAIHDNLKTCEQQTDKIIELQQVSK
jgi:hypothetical protein